MLIQKNAELTYPSDAIPKLEKDLISSLCNFHYSDAYLKRKSNSVWYERRKFVVFWPRRYVRTVFTLTYHMMIVTKELGWIMKVLYWLILVWKYGKHVLMYNLILRVIYNLFASSVKYLCNCSEVNLGKKKITMLIIFNWHCSEVIWKSNIYIYIYILKIMFSRLEIVFSRLEIVFSFT